MIITHKIPLRFGDLVPGDNLGRAQWLTDNSAVIAAAEGKHLSVTHSAMEWADVGAEVRENGTIALTAAQITAIAQAFLAASGVMPTGGVLVVLRTHKVVEEARMAQEASAAQAVYAQAKALLAAGDEAAGLAMIQSVRGTHPAEIKQAVRDCRAKRVADAADRERQYAAEVSRQAKVEEARLAAEAAQRAAEARAAEDGGR